MEWPARSPDLNPIEHLWDYLGREVAALNPPPRSLHELKRGLLCVWSSLPIPVSDNLINSMGNRCRQCIQAPQKKSKGLWSGEHGSRATGQPRLIHHPGYIAWGWLRIEIEKCAGAYRTRTTRSGAAGTPTFILPKRVGNLYTCKLL
ncbi:DDE_3 domain-containing protein [Trichonephila clavipes]|nr:DDE_3 domain-containing protein [Trichonephila clavipes]